MNRRQILRGLSVMAIAAVIKGRAEDPSDELLRLHREVYEAGQGPEQVLESSIQIYTSEFGQLDVIESGMAEQIESRTKALEEDIERQLHEISPVGPPQFYHPELGEWRDIRQHPQPVVVVDEFHAWTEDTLT